MAINMCLAVNGGSLGSGASEADRNDIFTVASHSCSAISGGFGGDGSYADNIYFPSCTIQYVKLRTSTSGNCSNAYASVTTKLLINGSWVTVHSLGHSNAGSSDSGVYQVNGPWNLVTGIHQDLVAHIGFPVAGAQYAYVYEIQCWASDQNNAIFLGINI